MTDGRGRGGRVLGVFLLLAALAMGAGAFWIHRHASEDPGPLHAAAGALATRSLAAIEGSSKALEPIALDATRVPELGAAFNNGVDAATFQDVFENEEWWRPFRKNGRASALYADGKLIASLFPERAGVRAAPLVTRALEVGAASGLAEGDGRAYAAAAARVQEKTAAAAKAVVLVGKPLDDAALGVAAPPTGASLALSDGKRLLASGGAGDGVLALPTLAGQEAASPLLTSGRLPAVATAVGPGLWLWAVGSLPLALPPVDQRPYALGGGGVLVLAIALGLIFRKGGGARAGYQAASQFDGPVTGRGLGHAPTAAVDSANVPANLPPNLHVNVPPELGGQTPGARPAPQRTAIMGAPQANLSPPTPAPVSSPGVLGQTVAAQALADAGASDLRGRYTLLEQIGSGGMAEVFRATLHGAEGFQRQLVVKRLLPNLAANKEAVSQFIDEARLQSGLVHSNIVPVLDFGRVGADYFLALEYIQGRDLEKLLRRHVERFGRGLDVGMAAFIVNEVLSALAYAHTKTDKDGRPLEIVHRDVSLANILISYVGEVKLSDFGIVKAEGRVSKTQIGMIKGNAGFMAPEQARGEHVDARADLFAVGAVLYSTLTGQPLYKAATGMNQLLLAAVGPATDLRQRIEGIGPEVAAILSRALVLDPAGRFPSAADFKRALRPLVTATRDDLAHLMRELFADEIQREGP